MLRFSRKCSRMLTFEIIFWRFIMHETSVNTDSPGARALHKLTGFVRRCVEDYKMIEDGETIAVGVSGGKDSVTLLRALTNLRGFYPKRFELHAVTLDLGFEGADFSPIEKLCQELSVPYSIQKTDFYRIVFEDRNEKNPCSLCAKMRRGALNDMIKALGIKKIALAHHFDDAVETFMLSLLYEGRISCFQPVTYMDRSGVTQIRPLLYVREGTVIRTAEKCNLPVVHNPCPMNGASKREEVKALLKTLSVNYPDLKNKIFGSIQRFPLDGWETK